MLKKLQNAKEQEIIQQLFRHRAVSDQAMREIERQSGFTIIEVLIVLAIAGLILLIVFLAVPALNRNAHNTQYKSEASRIASVTSEFVNNSNGAVPAGATAITCSGTGGSSGNCGYTTTPNAAMSIWQLAAPKNITAITIPINASTTAITPTLTALTLDWGVVCPSVVSGTSVTPSTTNASARGFIMVYGIESSGGTIAQCTQS